MHCQAQWTRNTIISEEPCGTRKEYYWWENLPKCKYKFKFSTSNVQAPNSKIKKGKKQHSTISDVLFTQGYRFWQPEKGWMSQALRKEKTKLKTEALTSFSVQAHTKLRPQLKISTLLPNKKGSLQQPKSTWLYKFVHTFLLCNIATKILLFLFDGHALSKEFDLLYPQWLRFTDFFMFTYALTRLLCRVPHFMSDSQWHYSPNLMCPADFRVCPKD